jgi:hypothetical protein
MGGETAAEHCLLQHYRRGTLLTQGCEAAMEKDIATATAQMGVEQLLEMESHPPYADGYNRFDEHSLPECNYPHLEDLKDLKD